MNEVPTPIPTTAEHDRADAADYAQTQAVLASSSVGQSTIPQRLAAQTASIPVWYLHLAGAGLAIGLTVGTWLLAIGPTVQARAKAIHQRQTLNKSRQQLQSLKSQSIQSESRLDQLRIKLESSPMHLAPASAINQPLADISELANHTGLTVRELGDETPQAWPHFRIVPIHLRGAARFSQMGRFLHQLHQQMPTVGVAGLELEASTNTAQADGQFALTLAWYTAPE